MMLIIFVIACSRISLTPKLVCCHSPPLPYTSSQCNPADCKLYSFILTIVEIPSTPSIVIVTQQ